MKSVDVGDLPPCAFGPQCLRLLDELDLPAACPSGCLTSIENLQERRQLRQLRSHLASCSTCSALLADARRARAQQRVLLYHVLKANERQVPSTAHLIIEAMRQTRAHNDAPTPPEAHVHAQSLSLLARPVERGSASHPLQAQGSGHPLQHRSLFHSVLTLATVAVVILAAAGLLNHFADQSASAPAGGNSSPFEHRQPGGDGWDTVLIGLTMLSAGGMVKGFTFYSYDAPADRLERIVSSTRTFAHVTMEGISHDGQSLLYDLASAHQRTYTIYSPAAGAHTVYQLPAGAGGNAIWVDSSHILVQQRAGLVVELDTQQGGVVRAWPIKAERLVCYHQPFLYFIAGGQANALYRANLEAVGASVQYVTDAQPDTRFWLSVDGTTVFYASRGAVGGQGIYAVHADGSNVHLLRAGLGLPIGYTDDNALLLLQQVGGRLEVVRLGRTPAQAERVLLTNAAPGATSLCGAAGLVAVIKICNGNIALEPHGHGLLLHAYYANGSHGLVYDNLQTGASQTILTLPASTTVQLPGWSKMVAAPAAGQLACLCA
jgi:hypothetical protein